MIWSVKPKNMHHLYTVEREYDGHDGCQMGGCKKRARVTDQIISTWGMFHFERIRTSNGRRHAING
jgi:hypothetical protein